MSSLSDKIMNAITPNDYERLIDAIYNDCKAIVEAYKEYPESNHLDNAKFIMRNIDEKQLNAHYIISMIANNDCSVKAKHRSDSIDGPINLADCCAFIYSLNRLKM